MDKWEIYQIEKLEINHDSFNLFKNVKRKLRQLQLINEDGKLVYDKEEQLKICKYKSIMFTTYC